ncbi:MAG: VIT and VWA domain-containing protein [Bryobacteraceae bacterium]
MKRSIALLLFAQLSACVLCADSGVIIPTDRQTPDPSVLALSEMAVDITIDSGHATVSMREVFHNKTDRVLEGAYTLVLPGDAAISDFAVWDGVVRIPGVILERKRAGELYDEIRNQAVDPGLLQSDEVSESNAGGEAKHSAAFTAKIAPIPSQGYKRIELQYRQSVPVEQLSSSFVLPLKPSTYAPETAERFSVTIHVRDPLTLTDFKIDSKTYPLKITRQDSHDIQASFTAENVRLSEDVSLEYRLRNDPKPAVQAYRDRASGDDGYFETSAILQDSRQAEAESHAPRTVVALFDTSLSMQWDKLERSFQSLEAILRGLRPSDNFNVLVFNSEVTAANPGVVPATPDAVARALDFVRASPLRGGTNLQKAYMQAFSEASAPGAYIALLSDGELTEGAILPARFGDWFDAAWNKLPAASRPHIYVMAIGDDANVRLCKRLASHAGMMEEVRSAEPVEFKLKAFVASIGLKPFDGVTLNMTPPNNFDLVYRLGQNDFPGVKAAWVGEYKRPGPGRASVETTRNGQQQANQTTAFTLPADDVTHEYLPAAWARARVDALLEKMDREGEDAASIAEIIRLSRKYKFVTPYTSFLAAPRALLRPRLIRPGDPVLRVRTDASIVSVIALFPFGLTQPLRYLKSEDMWQTRFLAPIDLPDGTHIVRLILRDRDGHVYREQKSFIIQSQPPVVRARLENSRVHPGDRVELQVRASQSTRTITAYLYGAEPVAIRWSPNDRANTGSLLVPATLPAGRYSIHVTAEDMAHNVSHQEVPLEVVP